MNLVDNCRYFYITSRMFNGFNAASAAAAALLVILGAQWGNEASGRNRWKGKWGGDGAGFTLACPGVLRNGSGSSCSLCRLATMSSHGQHAQNNKNSFGVGLPRWREEGGSCQNAGWQAEREWGERE